jgi:hypothetical protein
MSNEALDTMDEFESMDDHFEAELPAEEDSDEQADPVARLSTKSSKKRGKGAAQDKGIDMDYIGSKEESAETRSVASRAKLRSKMDSDVESFLKGGGEIQEIEPNVMADPPRKPISNYGSRPI